MTSFTTMGVKVAFSNFTPALHQHNIISNVIGALIDNKNALIESPKGTDRFLLVLGACIFYQKTYKTIPVNVPDVLDSQMGKTADNSAFKYSTMENEVPKIICVCKDQDSLSKAIHELKKIDKDTKSAVFSNFRNFCINDVVKFSNHPISMCKKLRSTGKCPFASISKENLDKNWLDLEEICDLCIKGEECAYLREERKIEEADIVFMTIDDYFTFHKANLLSVDKDKTIQIFESIPDLESAILQRGKFTLELDEYKELIPNKKEVGFLIELLQKIDSLILDKCAEALASGEKTATIAMDVAWSIFNFTANDWGKLNIDIYELTKLADSEEFITFDNFAKVGTVINLLRLSFNNPECFCMEFIPGEKNIKDHCIFHCINASALFKSYTENTHSVLVTANVLTPMQELELSLGVDFPVKISGIHSGDDNNDKFAAFTLAATNTGIQFKNTITDINERGEVMYESLGKMLESILQTIPDGVILYATNPMDIVCFWKKHDTIKHLKKLKPLFYSQKSKNYINEYKSSCFLDEGGLLITSDLESIAKMNGCCKRALFLFGVPRDDTDFANIVRSDRQMKKPKDEILKSFDWSEVNGIRLAYQCSDIPINSVDDYGIVVFIDKRYQSLVSKAPKWIKNHIQTANTPAHLTRLAKSFFTKAFPDSQEFQLAVDKQVLFTCANCEKDALLVKKIKTVDTINIEKIGFLNIVGADTEIEVLPIGGNVNKAILAQPQRIIWSDEDDVGYTPIFCECGCCLGAEVTMFSEETENLADTVFLIKDRVIPTNPTQNNFIKQIKSQKSQHSQQNGTEKAKSGSQKTIKKPKNMKSIESFFTKKR